MGYQNQTVSGNNGITWLVSTFQQIGKELEEQTVGSFALPTDQNFSGSSTIEMAVYGADGMQSARYYFVDELNAATLGLTKPGWYDADPVAGWYATDSDLADDDIIPFGYGVIITSGEADTPLTFSGQVVAEEKSYTVNGNNGITWTGNATPTEITLGDMALPTDQNFSGSSTIELAIYGSDGTLSARYYFVDSLNAGTMGLSSPGWYDADPIAGWYATDSDLKNGVKIPSGQMVIITSGESDTTLTLPNPMPKQLN